MKVEKWVPWEEASKLTENGVGGLGGFFQDGMRWGDYAQRFDTAAQPYIEALRASIVERVVFRSGEEQQVFVNSYPVWSDNTTDSWSWRAWGDLMAAIWSTEDDADYSYLDFYMGEPVRQPKGFRRPAPEPLPEGHPWSTTSANALLKEMWPLKTINTLTYRVPK